MADELSYLTINQAGDSWVDDIPDQVSTGYQTQNTNIESRNLGQDNTSISISGTNITLDPSGVIDDDGLPIVINSAVTLPVGSDGDWYIKVIAGSTSTQRSLALQSGGGTWDTSKQGYYDTGDRVLNWKITRASGVLKLFKRTKPNEGLELNGNIEAPQADISTVNATDVNATDVNATDVNATTVNATGVVTGGTFDSGNGATELYDMGQDMKTTDDVVFNSLNTGQGANELHPMDQGVRTTDDVIFNNITSNGSSSPSSIESSFSLTTTPQIIPRGIYQVSVGSSGYKVEIFVNSVWDTMILTSGGGDRDARGGVIYSDGTNVRISAVSTSFTLYYLRF